MKSCMITVSGVAAIRTDVLRPAAPIHSLAMKRDEQPDEKLANNPFGPNTGAEVPWYAKFFCEEGINSPADLIPVAKFFCEEGVELPADFLHELNHGRKHFCEEGIDLPEDIEGEENEKPILKLSKEKSANWFALPKFQKIWDNMPEQQKLLMPCQDSDDLQDDMNAEDMDRSGPPVRQWNEKDTEAWLTPKNKKIWDKLPPVLKAFMPCDEN